MRMLHTADWHLGRIFHGVHLTEDQAFTLEGFCAIARDTQPDVILISGDIYDRAVPPPEAVALLDHVLSRLVLELACPVIAISGNHDSAERFAFGGRLLSSAQLHLFGKPEAKLQSVTLLDEHGPVQFWPLPFCEPRTVRAVFQAKTGARSGQVTDLQERALQGRALQGHGSALRYLVAQAAAAGRPQTRQVVLAHGSVAGLPGHESERPLYLGPEGAADATIFKGFHYAALGHHHHTQDVGGDVRVRYPGSLLAYSFSESEHRPSVTLVDLDERGACTREVLELPVRHPVSIVKGPLTDLLEAAPSDNFLKVVLTDAGPVLDPLPRLRERYPNALVLVQERLLQARTTSVTAPEVGLDDEALFESFFLEMTGTAPSAVEHQAYREILERLFQTEREAL